jgi:hypothetical protein
MVKKTLDADDTRNPAYYELRAGYAEPDIDFFERKKDGKRTKVHYTDENFVQGFNLTCGEFYRLREAIAPHLIANGLYKLNFKDTDVEWQLFDVYDKVLQNHALIKQKSSTLAIPAYWAHKMLWKFLTRLGGWLNDNESFFHGKRTLELPKDSRWSWGPEREHKDYNGFYQLQHLSIQVRNEGHGDLIIELWDLVPRSTYPQKAVQDVSLSQVDFDMFSAKIKAAFIDFSLATHDITYNHPQQSALTFKVQDSSSLRSAITLLQVKFSFEVSMSLVPKASTADEVCFSCL